MRDPGCHPASSLCMIGLLCRSVYIRIHYKSIRKSASSLIKNEGILKITQEYHVKGVVYLRL